MNLTRRKALQLLVGSASTLAAGRLPGQSSELFTNTRESLNRYQVPEWFADAKFGIWSHWGPQSAIGDGDWYAHQMYVEGSRQYNDHLKRFGPQSKVGYKDLIHLFTADKWDPEHLIDLYSRAGAKYFVSMGVHCDNYDLWNSKYQPRWNSVASGPRMDIVGMWGAAARKRGLRFGVSEHLSNSFAWMAPAHLADTQGPYAGIPYDGQDRAYADLYHDYSAFPKDYPQRFMGPHMAMSRESPDSWKQRYLLRVKDLVDQHQPDMLYTDGAIPFEERGLAAVAEILNLAPRNLRGLSEGVFFSKLDKDCAVGTCVFDRERSITEAIYPSPWQTDTCIGEWHYRYGAKYKTAKTVIDLLVDIVSKNGNLLLNIPLPASGEPDAEELKVLAGITEWMSNNAEGIYATRPWLIHGEGPAANRAAAKAAEIAANPDMKLPQFNEDAQPALTASDIRYTRKNQTLFAFIQGWPPGELVLTALGTKSPQKPSKPLDVRLLGRDEPLKFVQDAKGLRVTLPATKPQAADIGIALRIRFA